MSDPRTAAGEGTNIVLERWYNSTVEELWDLWTTREGFESWWGPEGFRVEVHALEARVGGTLRYEMIADAPEHVAAMKRMGRPISHTATATFTQFEPRVRLALTHVVDFVPGVAAYDSTMRVEFHAARDRVRMVVTLTPMHAEEFTKMSVAGFTSQLAKLDRRFSWQPT
jgi:uncharacterized protein YndB with AHSA1/START domain